MKYIIPILLFLLVHHANAQYHPDRHNNSYNDGWISCEASASPNPARGDSHWIMYDLGEIYSLGTTHIWNTNVFDFTGIGIKTMMIDCSEDGSDWESFGPFEVKEATASSFYQGEEGPDLGGIEARYILITALSNYGGNCVGFSEIRINTSGIISDVNEVSILPVKMTAYPVPFRDKTIISLEALEAGPYVYRVTDVFGRTIMQNSAMIRNGRFQIDIDASGWPSGIYIFNLSNGHLQKSMTLEKINN